jgi:hypothetical protein
MPTAKRSLLSRGKNRVRRLISAAFASTPKADGPLPAWFSRDFEQFSTLSKQAQGNKSPPRFALSWEDRYPCLDDKTSTTPFDRHYIYHTAWAARVLAQTKPAEHVDISSTLYFSTLVSAFVPIRFYDYRPADLHLTQLTSDAADLTALPFTDASISSLSCMHVIEHIGLGRYGDPLDPEGDLKAFRELHRVLAVGGDLLVVVPVGIPRVCFNAHRIYDSAHVIASFPGCRLIEMALIPDNSDDGHLVANPDPRLLAKQRYGCGCFWFRKNP